MNSQRPQMVFQDPYGSLNPARTVGWFLEEALRASGVKRREVAPGPGDHHALPGGAG